MEAIKIRENVLRAVRVAETNEVHIPTQGQRGAIVGVLNRVCGGDDNRHLLMGWMFAENIETFSVKSTKNLSDAQWSALYGWCDFRKDEERNLWLPRPEFIQECLSCLSAAMRAYQNMHMRNRSDLPVPPEIVSIATTLGGEIREVDGVKGSAVRADDGVFAREKPLALPPPPAPESAPSSRPALREPFKSKPPKLINPF